MKTEVTTPQVLFGLPQHLTVPIYQRAYVWTEEDQWGPLWSDIRRLAERQLDGSAATHFLGAVVTQDADVQPTSLPERLIVDGQQRLTTLQLVFDAAAAAFRIRKLAQFDEQLEFCTHNAPAYRYGDSGLKLRHNSHDRDAFDEVMLAPPPVDHADLERHGSPVTSAHKFFSERVAAWLDQGPHPSEARAAALTFALLNALKLVVIHLEATEDAQEIFETLNARGTPLTATDLIKNFMFRRLTAEKDDAARAHREAWPFDTGYWEKEVSIGQLTTTRSAAFFGQWLVSRTGTEVSPRSTYTRFKQHVEHESILPTAKLLETIAAQADRYRTVVERSLDQHTSLDRLALHVYRMAAAKSEATRPVLIWLTEPGSPYLPTTADRVVATVESWFYRRRLLRLQSSDLGRIVADLVKAARGSSDTEVVGVVERQLTSQQSASTYWPGDDELRSVLTTEPFYQRFSPAVQRVVLQAVEDWYRGFTSDRPSKTGSRVERDGQQVEHLLPRAWRAAWPVADRWRGAIPSATVVAEADRDDHVHRLGNLTLLTGTLNSHVSNGPWLGDDGKRAALLRHDVLLMNRAVADRSADGWDEELIDQRTAEMVTALLETWPVPPGHAGKVVDRRSRLTKSTLTLADVIAAGLLDVGTVLVPTSVRWSDRCQVLPGGRLLCRSESFGSLSAAADNVSGGTQNGWLFWQVDGGPVLDGLRDQLLGTTVDARTAVTSQPDGEP